MDQINEALEEMRKLSYFIRRTNSFISLKDFIDTWRKENKEELGEDWKKAFPDLLGYKLIEEEGDFYIQKEISVFVNEYDIVIRLKVF